MNKRKITRLAERIIKTAGEVRFVKDKSNDSNSWAYTNDNVEKRDISKKYTFNKEKAQPLSEVLNNTMEALEHASSAYNTFSKLKSVDISPDGMLGGKGYIAKIIDVRKQFMNIVEALSAISDTLHDEINAQHWKGEDENKRERGKMEEDEKNVQLENNEPIQL